MMTIMIIWLFLSFLLLTGCVTRSSIDTAPTTDSSASSMSSRQETGLFRTPLARARARVTKKPFGIQVSPSSSPVHPERFMGYHSGVDFEALPDEQNEDVWVSAICAGTVRFRGWVKGYGGLLIEECTYQGAPITVLYGHLNSDSVSARTATSLKIGASIGTLGKGFSSQTDGERKHLYLGIHRGSSLTYRGYVSTSQELADWVDVMTVIR